MKEFYNHMKQGTNKFFHRKLKYKYLDMFEGDLVEATKYGQHANKLEMVQAFVECVRLSGDRDEPKVEVKLRDILRVLNSLAYTRS